MKSKICSKCHLEKSLSQFNKDSSLKSGISSYCKACSRIKWLEYKARRGIITKSGGFSQEDALPVKVPPEEEFQDIFGGADYVSKGKYVMKEGRILDEKWYQKKLKCIKKHLRRN